MKRTLAEFSRATLTTASITMLMVVATPAFGQAVCAPREQMTDFLGVQFSETMTAAGVDQNGNLVQVFSSRAGSWTIVLRVPGGLTCLLSASEGWTFADDRNPAAHASPSRP